MSPPSPTAYAPPSPPGCKTVVLTNGCGGLREGMRPGQPVLISDHINLTATSPIVGANFVDLTDLYSPRLRALCQEVDPSLEEGVYVQFPGPHYETPAEIGMVRAIGGDLVGMSTVLEAIAAREAGAEVLGISLVTNLAAGHDRRAAQPRGGPPGGPRLGRPDGRAAGAGAGPDLSGAGLARRPTDRRSRPPAEPHCSRGARGTST